MDGGLSEGSEARFAAYIEALGAVLGHADRQEPMRDYCLGLLMPIERKSVEPMAAVTAPAQVAAKHQSLLHFVGNAPWSDAAMLARVGQLVLPAIERSGPIEAWIIDDTGFPKKGRHSVGVTRQYCGQLGKQDNCQVAVSLSLANHDASLPITMPVCQSRIGSIFLKIGPRIRRGGTRPGCRRQSLSKPSPRSPLSRSKRPARRGSPRAWC
jgi:SRSO17 transposase